MKSATLNEGLEKLGEKRVVNGITYEGNTFSGCAIESAILPSTLKRVEAKTFFSCQSLKSIEIANGTEYIGRKCFFGSGIEEIVFPSTLRKADKDVLSDCKKLKVV